MQYKITLAQKIAKRIGKDMGGNSHFCEKGKNYDQSYPYNRSIRVDKSTSKPLGDITYKDLWNVLRNR